MSGELKSRKDRERKQSEHHVRNFLKYLLLDYKGRPKEGVLFFGFICLVVLYVMIGMTLATIDTQWVRVVLSIGWFFGVPSAIGIGWKISEYRETL